VVSHCHLSATPQTISITVVNSQDNRAVGRIFIALLRFLLDFPSQFTAGYKMQVLKLKAAGCLFGRPAHVEAQTAPALGDTNRSASEDEGKFCIGWPRPQFVGRGRCVTDGLWNIS